MGDRRLLSGLAIGKLKMYRLSAASRAYVFILAAYLGFRCAPPQALCRRPLRGLVFLKCDYRFCAH